MIGQDALLAAADQNTIKIIIIFVTTQLCCANSFKWSKIDIITTRGISLEHGSFNVVNTNFSLTSLSVEGSAFKFWSYF